MTRDDVERELREKLKAARAQDGLGRFGKWDRDDVVAALLPWVMEMREEAAMQERIECGELP